MRPTSADFWITCSSSQKIFQPTTRSSTLQLSHVKIFKKCVGYNLNTFPIALTYCPRFSFLWLTRRSSGWPTIWRRSWGGTVYVELVTETVHLFLRYQVQKTFNQRRKIRCYFRKICRKIMLTLSISGLLKMIVYIWVYWIRLKFSDKWTRLPSERQINTFICGQHVGGK